MKALLSSCTKTLASSTAILLIACLVMTGCTPAQQQTTLQVVTEVDTHIPEVVAAAGTVSATIAALAPADAAIVGVADTAFAAAAGTLQALCASYIKTPTASVLTQIQNAVTALEAQVNTATLNAVGIKDITVQNLVLAALKGLLTIVTVVFALVAPTLTTAQLEQLREEDTIHLARVRRYMDQQVLEREARSAGLSVDKSFAMATAAGL
jgi:hypothetical protein